MLFVGRCEKPGRNETRERADEPNAGGQLAGQQWLAFAGNRISITVASAISVAALAYGQGGVPSG